MNSDYREDWILALCSLEIKFISALLAEAVEYTDLIFIEE